MAFIPPQGNKTVMVDNSNNIVYPASFQKVVATQATIAGNNFTDVPSVIDPENATTTQLPSVASVVNYVADVVEGGSSGLIPAIQSDIQTLEQVKSNRGEFWFQGGTSNLRISNLTYNQGDSFSFAVQIKAKLADVAQGARIFQFNIFNLYFNPRLCIYCPSAFGSSVIITTPEQNNKILDGNWHSIICTYDGITCKLFDEDGLLISASGTIPNIANTYFLIGNSFVGQMSRIKYFNFDMSSDDAPYTIADYVAGKDESPLLSGTLLSLDNYSIKIGATKIVPDVSGNNNDATIVGSVYGSKDTSIAKMAQLFYQSQQG